MSICECRFHKHWRPSNAIMKHVNIGILEIGLGRQGHINIYSFPIRKVSQFERLLIDLCLYSNRIFLLNEEGNDASS